MGENLQEPWSRVSHGGMVVDGDRRWLKLYHEKALEGLEKDRELGMNKDLDQDQGRELSLGKGFDRGFGL